MCVRMCTKEKGTIKVSKRVEEEAGSRRRCRHKTSTKNPKARPKTNQGNRLRSAYPQRKTMGGIKFCTRSIKNDARSAPLKCCLPVCEVYRIQPDEFALHEWTRSNAIHPLIIFTYSHSMSSNTVSMRRPRKITRPIPCHSIISHIPVT